MLAATRGSKLEATPVIDFMPSDSLRWEKRKRKRKRGITSPTGQSAVIKHAFGFR